MRVKAGATLSLWTPILIMTSTLHFLVQARSGFTSRLLSHREQCFSSLIGGPFGQSIDVGRFGTILILATTDVGTLISGRPSNFWTFPHSSAITWVIRIGVHRHSQEAVRSALCSPSQGGALRSQTGRFCRTPQLRSVGRTTGRSDKLSRVPRTSHSKKRAGSTPCGL